MILVAGGTGRLGSVLVDRLVDRNLEVRVLTRDPGRAARLVGGPVEVVVGDVQDRESLGPATAGVEVVVSAVHGFGGRRANAPAAVDRDGNANLIDAAKTAGSEFVLMSTVGAAADSPMELFRMKHAAEQRAAGSAVPTTIVRSTAFLELWIDLLRQTAGRSGRPLVFGRGANPINFVSVADVAAVVEYAVIDPITRGKILEVGGPDNLTLDHLAEAVQAAAGRRQRPRHIPPPVLDLVANSVGRVKPRLGRQARAALVMDHADLSFDSAPIHHLYPDLPWTTLADVLGRDRARQAA
jgi:NADH dehydrogenase